MSRRMWVGLVAAGLALGGRWAWAEEPALPSGLAPVAEPTTVGSSDEPGLPAGLEGATTDAGEPGLPEGLAETAPETVEPRVEKPALPFDLTGFFDFRGGMRTQRDPHEERLSLGEARLQLMLDGNWGKSAFEVTADFLYDAAETHHSDIDLDSGEGWIDLRKANLSWTPLSYLDVRVGRQILTWGTGDLVFINDLFPKDYVSFFVGRDVEYLKAPSDAVKLSVFTPPVNVNFVYTPKFDPDRFITGERLSYFNATLGRTAGRDAVIRADLPNDWFTDDEKAVRMYRNLGGYELALYGYWGFWKSPAGMDAGTGRATFPELAVYGASIRGAVGKGIGNVEFGYYDSLEDREGTDPLVTNGQWRVLVGYEQELAKDFTAGIQWYLERMTDYDEYLGTLPAGVSAAKEDRHVVTVRLTKMLMDQNLTLSLFAFYSPSDSDAYLRPHAKYKINDHWSVEAGANVFLGAHEDSFFGQFQKDTNLYLGARYGF